MAIVEGKKENFENMVLNSEKVLVDFNATWCGPCKMLKPIIEEISNERQDIKVVSVDIDLEEELSLEYQVSSIPCLILFQKGKVINRMIGFHSKEDIETMIGGK